MSRIKQEIDRSLEYYGDQATVFRVVRRAVWYWSLLVDHNLDITPYIVESPDQKRIIRHIRRLLPIERPVTTERLKQAMEGK